MQIILEDLQIKIGCTSNVYSFLHTTCMDLFDAEMRGVNQPVLEKVS